jgi:hypothetical protein
VNCFCHRDTVTSVITGSTISQNINCIQNCSKENIKQFFLIIFVCSFYLINERGLCILNQQNLLE